MTKLFNFVLMIVKKDMIVLSSNLDENDNVIPKLRKKRAMTSQVSQSYTRITNVYYVFRLLVNS